jgi:hypothetical protein
VYEEEKNHGKKGGEDKALGNHMEKMHSYPRQPIKFKTCG